MHRPWWKKKPLRPQTVHGGGVCGPPGRQTKQTSILGTVKATGRTPQPGHKRGRPRLRTNSFKSCTRERP
ncbi:hypothetical protein [Streptomyces sp. NBC_00645]|uniref:hypothetical protein n=1 Tax=Streptomyces sp. NBC_00645 TaxID=2975795 RepID=UPI003245B39E